MPKLNAVDAISPAFNLTKMALFKPFRWGFWLRIAVLGLLTGEMSTGGGGGGNFSPPANWNTHDHNHFLAGRPFPFDPHLLWTILPVVIGAVLVLGLILMYVGSVCRFVLLEAVLNGQVSLREGWSRWQRQGTRFFVFKLLLGFCFLAIAGAIALLLVGIVGVSSLKRGMGTPEVILGVLFGFFLLFLFALPFILIHLLAKDFAVPVMALEGATFGEAWRRVWAMMKSEFGSVAGYVGMKIVLTIGVGVIFGIIMSIVILVVAVPIGGLGVATVIVGKATGMTWTPAIITLFVAAVAVLIAIILFVISVVCAPVTFFFPSYGLYFFAGRYQPLHDRLFPPLPPAQEPPPAPLVEPPPEPMST